MTERTAELARTNEALRAEVIERRLAEQARNDLLRRLVSVQEEERGRIARELHDQMGQQLTALKLGLESLEGPGPLGEGESRHDRLRQMLELTRRIGHDMHRIAWELGPAALDELDLPTALSSYAEEWSGHSHVPIQFHCSGPWETRLSSQVETTLYRVVQEALTNVAKHARADRLSLILNRRDDQLLAIVEDDGVGFDAENGMPPGRSEPRLGLIGMKQRVEAVGGVIQVEFNAWTRHDGLRPSSRAARRREVIPMGKLRILLADDHGVVREGLKSLINAQPDLEVIGEACDGLSACQKATELRPEVVVMDVSMPGLTGDQATAQLKQACPDVKVLALTVHEDKNHLRKMLKAGASGYILKLATGEEFIRAVRAVAAGGVYLDPVLAGKVVDDIVNDRAEVKTADTVNLTERETQIALRVAQGFSNKEIAAQLEISVKTVETHKLRSMEKLGLSTRADMVQYALRRGWLTQE